MSLGSFAGPPQNALLHLDRPFRELGELVGQVVVRRAYRRHPTFGDLSSDKPQVTRARVPGRTCGMRVMML